MTLAANEPVRPSNPSFDCRAHHSDAEVTICNSPELSLLDNQLDQLYMRALKALGETKRKELVLGQRQWIRGVINCATDVNCLTAQYQDQLQKLKTVLPDHNLLPGRRPAGQAELRLRQPAFAGRGRGLQ